MKDLCEDRRLLLGMVICTAASILLKCICAIIYHKLLHDSRQLQTTKNKWLRAMLTKYEASYKIRISINDPDCFVSRHLERYHVFKLSLYTLENTDLFAAALLISTSLLADPGNSRQTADETASLTDSYSTLFTVFDRIK